MPNKRIVVATANAGKVRELAHALASLGCTLVTQRELGIASVAETGATFVENALLKARHAAAKSGLPAIGDDSGLVVPALAGAPGIRSARFAGEDATDAANNAMLLAALDGIRDRQAHFYCALVHLTTPGDPAPSIATARWGGVIVDEPKGDNGFGYDPHFLVPALGKTAAELAVDDKNALSHRGQACRRLASLLGAARSPPRHHSTAAVLRSGRSRSLV